MAYYKSLPSRNVHRGVKCECEWYEQWIHENLRKAANLGVAVLLISEDLDEIMSVSDYIGVINRGKIVGEFTSPADRHELGKLMTDHA